MNALHFAPANFSIFLKFSQLSLAFYHKSLTSLAMTLVIPLGFLLVSSFTYYAGGAATPITMGSTRSVAPAVLAQVESARLPGLQIVPIVGGAAENIRDGNAQLVLDQDEGDAAPSLYTLERNKALADVVAVALSGGHNAPAYAVKVATNGAMSFAFLPGLLIMSLMNLALFTTGAKLLEDRAKGTLRLFRLFPVPLYIIFSAEAATKLLLALAQAALFVLLGDYLLELHLNWATIVSSIGVAVLCAFSLLSLGMALGSNLRSYSSGIHVFTILNLLMIFMGDLMFPNTNYPATRVVAFFLPATHCVNLLRQTMLDYPASFSVATSVAYLSLFTALMALWTLKGFRYTAEE
jgi:ABC-type multidrug transport system permease subunit